MKDTLNECNLWRMKPLVALMNYNMVEDTFTYFTL